MVEQKSWEEKKKNDVEGEKRRMWLGRRSRMCRGRKRKNNDVEDQLKNDVDGVEEEQGPKEKEKEMKEVMGGNVRM